MSQVPVSANASDQATSTGSKTDHTDTCSHQARTLRRTSSGVRLSLTSQGSAKILQEDEASPTPPSSPPGTMSTLNSARDSHPAKRKVVYRPAMPVGRSRDSRAWEFWCDDDSRNDLAVQANRESTGSAADAINIMRSNKRKALVPLEDGKLPPSDATKFKRLKAGRTKSGPAKLMRSFSANDKRICGTSEKPRVNARLRLHHEGEDSDKENEDPNVVRNLNANPRPLKEAKIPRRPPLVSSHTAPTHSHSNVSASIEKSVGRSRLYRPPRASASPEADDEVAAFMRSTAMCRDQPRKQNTSGEDDMDCIHSLLSLSQGKWR